MSRLRKCDRCDEVYEQYVGGNTVAIAEFNLNDEQLGAEEYYDLCPKCKKEFDAWLNTFNKVIAFPSNTL